MFLIAGAVHWSSTTSGTQTDQTRLARGPRARYALEIPSHKLIRLIRLRHLLPEYREKAVWRSVVF